MLIQSSFELNLKSIYIEITNKCNLYCKHCYNASGIQNDMYLDSHVIERIYQEFHNQKIKHIALSGGEPFLHPDIINILTFSRKFNIETQLVSNGVYIGRYYNEIVDNPYLTLQLSLDGIGETHNQLRGDNVFELVDRNLHELKDTKNYKIIKCTLNKNNINECEKLIEYGIEKKVNKIAFSLLYLQGRLLENTDILLNTHECIKVLSELKELKKRYSEIIEIKIPTIDNRTCPFITTEKADISPRVDVYGNVYLCSMFNNDKFSLGNINTAAVSDIIKSNRAKNVIQFINSFYKINKCSGCFIDSVCRKGCPAQYLNGLLPYETIGCDMKKNTIYNYLCTHIK